MLAEKGFAFAFVEGALVKAVREGWWLVLGDVDTHELLALKRISFADHTTARLTFPVMNGAGKQMTGVTLFFMSDSYLGLDQQYFVPVVPKQRSQQQQRQAQHELQPKPQQRQGQQNDSGPAQSALLQRPASESGTGASLGQGDAGDTGDVTTAVGLMGLGSDAATAGPGVNGWDQTRQEAKQQRTNARRRRN